MKILRIPDIIGDGICVDQYSTVVDRPQTRVWWSLPSSRSSSSRDAGDGEYSDILVNGTLRGSALEVDGHTKADAVKVEIGTGVTTLANLLFDGCTNLIEVSLPSTLNPTLSILQRSFNGTIPNLQRILVSKYNPKWGSIQGILVDKTQSIVVTFPKGKTPVFIPDGMSHLYIWSYQYLPELQTLPNIPDSVKNINNYAFRGCTGLTSVSIPDTVTTIGSNVFQNCNNITSVTIPQCVCSKQLSSVFPNYKSITDINITQGVTSIQGSAFAGCSSITSLTIPDNVTSIGNSALNACINLTSLTLPFVGGMRGEITNSSQNIFGYIFGSASYTGGLAKQQSYYAGGGYLAQTYYFPPNLTSVTFTDETEVGPGAFSGCDQLTSITLNEGVTKIGNRAFYGCNFNSIRIPDSVTSIGEEAFYACGITSVTIPASITSIGTRAFGSCPHLTHIEISDLRSWCGLTFSSAANNPLNSLGGFYMNGSLVTSLDIPQGTTSIGQYVFSGCTSVTIVSIPSSITEIGNGAFNNCSNIARVDITDLDKWCDIQFSAGTSNPTNFAGGLWLNGQQITNLVIPITVTEILPFAFYKCSSMTSLTLPNGITSIGASAFGYCGFQGALTIPNGVTSIDTYAFRNCTGITSISLPNTLTSLGNGAFGWCSGIQSMIIPNSVTTIGNATLRYCSGLTSVTLSNSINGLGTYLFGNCTGLTSIEIPSSVNTIMANAFNGCSNLAVFDFHNHTQVPTLSNYSAFTGTPANKKIVVPDDLYESWKTATNWSSTTNNIVGSIVKYSEYINT